ncbi:MAG: adenine phosphoribosyltransferase [Flammeovirgaceae bacterium]|nr:adenine phosphoribosyltransferase [Flammeovirgaceae bacterium]
MDIRTELDQLIRDIPDFPRKGIVFKDITPVLSNSEMCLAVVAEIKNHFASVKVDAIAAIEARGFIMGGMIAHEMNIPFIPVRKAGKLPYEKIEQKYDLEYGTAIVEMHKDAIEKGWNVLIHDDLLATGGTAEAAGKMIQRLGGKVAGFSFMVNLSFLLGEDRLRKAFGTDTHYLISY